mmetsp:Transcript_21722/g.43925  ORF Transcript_21722/g.43925 Transcript_21722/m.43925 type:complete len:218 (-) Transcript_21722:1298-1951(-)
MRDFNSLRCGLEGRMSRAARYRQSGTPAKLRVLKIHEPAIMHASTHIDQVYGVACTVTIGFWRRQHVTRALTIHGMGRFGEPARRRLLEHLVWHEGHSILPVKSQERIRGHQLTSEQPFLRDNSALLAMQQAGRAIAHAANVACRKLARDDALQVGPHQARGQGRGATCADSQQPRDDGEGGGGGPDEPIVRRGEHVDIEEGLASHTLLLVRIVDVS